MEKETKIIAIPVDFELWERINAHSKETGLKKAFLIKKIIKEYFDNAKH